MSSDDESDHSTGAKIRRQNPFNLNNLLMRI